MTLDDPAQSRDRYDCVVVGAGPAGSMTARELARGGASVLLVEHREFPRPKVCGCCLNPRALATLQKSGLGALPASLGAIPLRGIELAAWGRRVRLRHPLGVALSRDALDLALANEAVAAGAVFSPGTRAELLGLQVVESEPVGSPVGWALPTDPGLRSVGSAHPTGQEIRLGGVGIPAVGSPVGWALPTVPGPRTVGSAHPTKKPGSQDNHSRAVRLHDREGERVVHAGAVVAATGLNDTLHDDATGRGLTYRPGSKIGAGVIAAEAPVGYEPGLIYMACGLKGYVGLVVLEDGRLDLAAALGPEAIKAAGGIGPLARSILQESGLPEVPDVDALPWRGTPRLTRASSVVAREGVYRVGDAAGYVEPFTGEGMAWAIARGVRLGAILGGSARESQAKVEQEWATAHRREVVRRQAVCRAASLALRTPWLMRASLGLIGIAPGLARPVMRAMHRA